MLGILRDRQREHGDPAGQRDDDRQHRGEDRPVDEELRKHGSEERRKAERRKAEPSTTTPALHSFFFFFWRADFDFRRAAVMRCRPPTTMRSFSVTLSWPVSPEAAG